VAAPGRPPYAPSVADTLSAARLLLAAAMVWAGLRGLGWIALAMLVAAAVTDFLDGQIARRRGGSRFGPHLDAVADMVLLAATAAALALLHPRLVRDEGIVLVGVGALYAAGTMATWLASRRLADPRQLTAKLAGGALYAFALYTLGTGDYEPVLLIIAAGALTVSSAEAILRAIATTQPSWTASRQRSHAPQAEKGVMRRTAATARIATSTEPNASDVQP